MKATDKTEPASTVRLNRFVGRRNIFIMTNTPIEAVTKPTSGRNRTPSPVINPLRAHQRSSCSNLSARNAHVAAMPAATIRNVEGTSVRIVAQ